ncbi:unnamed protein product [Sphagnum troendelagicum]
MKFGKRLLRIVAIMPSQYREKLFLDYDMLKGNIKDFVNATLAFRNDEPGTAAVSASLEDGDNDTSHVLSLLADEEENTEVGLLTGEEGVQEDAEFNQFMDWIIEENAQSRLTEPEVEENTEAELIESDVGVQELDVEHIELMNWVSIGFPGMAPDVEPIELIDWASTAHPGMPQALGLDYGISPHPIWQSLDSWELRSGWWPSYGNEKHSQPLELMLGDGVDGRVEKQGGGLDVDIVEPKQWHSGIEGVDPEVEAFIHHVFHSEGDNAADDAHILSYQVTIFKRMLDGEFFQINKIFVALHEHNVALMAKLELMKVEEEARQTSLHASRSCWDMRKLQALQRRIAQLYVDFTILAYCSSVNYEDLRWNYIHHVEAQDFYVLQPQFQEYTKQCERLMGVGELEQPSMSDEELDLEHGDLTLISRLLEELSVTTEHPSSTHNAQSFRPPASAQLMCLQGSIVN